VDAKALERGGVSMSHFEKQKWMAYVEGTLQEDESLILEEHLFTCDECMMVYMQCVEAEEEMIPALLNPKQFADNIMENLPSFDKQPILSKRKFYESPFFHYGIAAAITLVFMSSGIFTELLNFINLFQAESLSQDSAPVSDTIMHKTVNILENIKQR
jgi:hypothetical protein